MKLLNKTNIAALFLSAGLLLTSCEAVQNANNQQKVINGEGEYEELIVLPKDSIFIQGQVKDFRKNGVWKTKYSHIFFHRGWVKVFNRYIYPPNKLCFF
jgi:hypothetical protein